ncbi:40S ribosomal protein S7-like [Tropilaelaps mercedesae]|uniref:40S ribosomal protein S7 n=1 Tax=Tropilaelaps mercedesae TaxID=418985 RepID=A0A1V9Y245_9ACAR|nr:40S ribosomal protein S7-like [Tropilaelaps mercedesae]
MRENSSIFNMSTAGSKCVKPAGENPDEFEEQVAKTLLELEVNSELRTNLKELYFVSAKEIEVGDKKAVLIYVPYPQLKLYHKIHTRLVRELEKKFSGKTVIFLARRTILPKPSRKSKRQPKQKRPMSRTLTHVHNAILEDIVYPAEIIGKRIRYRIGTRLFKVLLEKAQQTNMEQKVDTFSAVYKRLTGKEVAFEFREPLV